MVVTWDAVYSATKIMEARRGSASLTSLQTSSIAALTYVARSGWTTRTSPTQSHDILSKTKRDIDCGSDMGNVEVTLNLIDVDEQLPRGAHSTL